VLCAGYCVCQEEFVIKRQAQEAIIIQREPPPSLGNLYKFILHQLKQRENSLECYLSINEKCRASTLRSLRAHLFLARAFNSTHKHRSQNKSLSKKAISLLFQLF
jgi:hypothetical protein